MEHNHSFLHYILNHHIFDEQNNLVCQNSKALEDKDIESEHLKFEIWGQTNSVVEGQKLF